MCGGITFYNSKEVARLWKILNLIQLNQSRDKPWVEIRYCGKPSMRNICESLKCLFFFFFWQNTKQNPLGERTSLSFDTPHHCAHSVGSRVSEVSLEACEGSQRLLSLEKPGVCVRDPNTCHRKFRRNHVWGEGKTNYNLSCYW